MKTSEIRDLSVEEIEEKVDQSKKELFGLRIQAKTGKLEKQSRLRILRRDVARMMTVYNELKEKDKGKNP